MPGRKPWHDSPYDEHGMPLGCETVDYDNGEEVKAKMVQDKYVPEIPLNDPEYQPKQMSKKFTGQRPLVQKDFNRGMETQPESPEIVDIEDPGERRELLVREADEKGFSEVPELPKVEDKEEVDKIGAEDDRNPEQETHQENLEKNEEEEREAQDEQRKEIEEPEPLFLKAFAAEQKDENNDGVQK